MTPLFTFKKSKTVVSCICLIVNFYWNPMKRVCFHISRKTVKQKSRRPKKEERKEPKKKAEKRWKTVKGGKIIWSLTGWKCLMNFIILLSPICLYREYNFHYTYLLYGENMFSLSASVKLWFATVCSFCCWPASKTYLLMFAIL